MGARFLFFKCASHFAISLAAVFAPRNWQILDPHKHCYSDSSYSASYKDLIDQIIAWVKLKKNTENKTKQDKIVLF